MQTANQRQKLILLDRKWHHWSFELFRIFQTGGLSLKNKVIQNDCGNAISKLKLGGKTSDGGWHTEVLDIGIFSHYL